MIADERYFPLGPGERQMIGGVARRRHRLQLPSGTFDHFAVAHPYVRLEVAVGAGLRAVLLTLESRPRRAMRSFGVNGCAGGGLDPCRVRRVVAMGMGDQNMRHGLA